ncbi:MAG TPA: aminotransferase class V-fold PLP-dependent enzyme [Symbiobacteriaceae bacterium]|nr:aminotransferase class V-fold PLP-dependent enzyme [Symbiobacteriaceae bacterium]
MDLIYLDHAATSWPKPPAVLHAVLMAMEVGGGNPGRSGHQLAMGAARRLVAAREALARLLGAPDPSCISFTKNATEALNTALLGLLRPGDHVVTTAVEHNSVMRPLRHLERQGVRVTVVPCTSDGLVDPELVRRGLTARTRLVVATHASNVLGAVQPIAELGEVAHRGGALFLVDAAQTAGSVPIDVQAMSVDLLAFPGHKALLGPQGTGGLYVRPGVDLPPLLRGGTGSASELEEQPDFAPDRYESGTPNVPGIAGLGAAAEHLLSWGIDRVREKEQLLVARFMSGLANIPDVVVYGPPEPTRRVGLVSLNLRGVLPSALGQALEEGYGILTRVGLHCAPAAHRTAGTYPDGSVRFSFSGTTALEHVNIALRALEELSVHART